MLKQQENIFHNVRDCFYYVLLALRAKARLVNYILCHALYLSGIFKGRYLCPAFFAYFLATAPKSMQKTPDMAELI